MGWYGRKRHTPSPASCIFGRTGRSMKGVRGPFKRKRKSWQGGKAPNQANRRPHRTNSEGNNNEERKDLPPRPEVLSRKPVLPDSACDRRYPGLRPQRPGTNSEWFLHV